MAGREPAGRVPGRTRTVALVLQGLQVGGMERCAIQLATSARRAGYEAKLVLYDTPSTRGEGEYDPGDIPVAFVPRTSGVDLTLPLRLARLFKQWNVDIVHSRNNVAAFYSAAAIALISPAPQLLVTFDTFPGTGTAKARLTSRWASCRAAIVSSVSYDLSKRLVESGWVTTCQTAWNGVDHRHFSPDGPGYGIRAQLGLPAETTVVGQVARLDQNKRQEDLIQAFDRLRARKPNVALALAGDGPDRERIARMAESRSNVFLLGTLDDVAGFLRDLDVFVLCSDEEGCPRALLEAMACGKAIVATKAGGIPEILDGCGLLTRRRDPEKLAEAITTLCRAPELRTRLGKAARRAIMQSFTLEDEWDRYEQMYDAMLR